MTCPNQNQGVQLTIKIVRAVTECLGYFYLAFHQFNPH